MKPPELLLARLHEAGVTLIVEGDVLRAQAPAGALTPFLRESVARYKADLIALVGAGADHPVDGWLAEMRREMAPEIHDPPDGCAFRFACSRLGVCERHAAGRPCVVHRQ